VTTFDSGLAPSTTQSAAPIFFGGAASTRAHQHERRHKQLRASLFATVDAHIARAVALLDGQSGPRVTRQVSDRGPIPRGGFAAWQSRRLAAHVDAHLAGRIVIKDLAASLDISVGHFCRAFKHTFGMPARIWIRHRRIEFAQGLMLKTGASLSEIALSCGMSDQSHFTRSFRRIVGETPSSWRQTRHDAIEERITELAYPRATSPIILEGV
jgi:AraC-like DNA-binding protein